MRRSLIFSFCLLMPTLAFAQAFGLISGDTYASLPTLVNSIYRAALSIGVGLLAVMLAYAAFRYVASFGNPAGVKEATSIAVDAVLGFLLLILVARIFAQLSPGADVAPIAWTPITTPSTNPNVTIIRPTSATGATSTVTTTFLYGLPYNVEMRSVVLGPKLVELRDSFTITTATSYQQVYYATAGTPLNDPYKTSGLISFQFISTTTRRISPEASLQIVPGLNFILKGWTFMRTDAASTSEKICTVTSTNSYTVTSTPANSTGAEPMRASASATFAR